MALFCLSRLARSASCNERSTIMGLSWQQGPLSGASVGRFLTPEPLPKRLLFAEPLRRRLRVKFAEEWIADSEDVLLLHEPGRYPVAYFPLGDVQAGVLVGEKPNTRTPTLGDTEWFTVTLGDRRETRGAWHYTAPPDYAGEFRGRVAFTWRAMDGFYEGRAHRRSRRRSVSPQRHPPELAPPRREGRHEDCRRHQAAAGAVRVRFRAALVRAAPGHRRERADSGRRADVLPLQGPRQLLRHRRAHSGRVVLPAGVARGRARLRFRLLRAGRDRRFPRRQEAFSRGGPGRQGARNRPKPGPRGDAQTRQRSRPSLTLRRWPGCSRSTSGCRARSSGAEESCARPSGRKPCRVVAASSGSTSKATGRPTSAATVGSSARSSSIRSNRIATGRSGSAGTI